ncbi:ABC transporter permease [Actomonas aquatica]|uniref:ABC-2 family transporter protein n=1 Tax=Actomonas aquatica TaxID=2866162 RepID=A0ABZ1C8L9_9BACT|nr:ABC-2 family transporter protein [Opitutus sp. WL0086]WRQ87970.1 ABC-2 family transporter protein [Opitutus sp. WL0086]
MLHYFRLWLASARYSVIRSMMFRGDFIMWSLVELFWMAVNIAAIAVIYEHTDAVAGWSKYEMILLVGTTMLIQRMLMGFFWSNLFELGRNIRTGNFDFFLAQPGNLLFIVSTRKLDLDGLINVFVALAVVLYAVKQLGIEPSFLQVATYASFVFCGLAISYAMLLLFASISFWAIGSQGLEGTYFTFMEFARLPREAFRGVANVIFVWVLPAVVLSNAPARALIDGFDPVYALWLGGATVAWLGLSVTVFRRGLRRYSSASS